MDRVQAQQTLGLENSKSSVDSASNQPSVPVNPSNETVTGFAADSFADACSPVNECFSNGVTSVTPHSQLRVEDSATNVDPKTRAVPLQAQQFQTLCMVFAVLIPDLAADLAAGSPTALTRAIERLLAAVSRSLPRYVRDRANIARQVVAQLLHELCCGMMDRYDPSRTTVRRFIFAAIRNIARSTYRKERTDRRRELDLTTVASTSETDAEDDERRERMAERLRRVQEAFDRADYEDRIALADKYRFLAPDLHGPVRSPAYTQVRRCRALDKLSADPGVNGNRHL